MERYKIRKPAVAGQFYPSSASALKREIEDLVDINTQKIDAIACMLPHAGYMYSGSVAAQTVSRIKVKDKIILLGPNHTGYGLPFSIMTEGLWQTPLGRISIDSSLAGCILSKSRYLKEDNLAHIYEHSLEVELPFLQYFKNDFEIVPIVLLSDEIDILKEIGRDIAEGLKGGCLDTVSFVIVASSDMTHYEPHTQAQMKDKQAIEAILELNEDKLMDRIRRLDISMCGYSAVVAMLSAAKSLGACSAQLVKYQTSGDITGDVDSVVGYAGIIVY
ncbi:MAG: AmmeMemoRadiSam system protein B [Candidatus Omnitrophica bacterium]|nr:AmmeMemoRadiSam system protein B [Candidatus Omnitrophota bacterium]